MSQTLSINNRTTGDTSWEHRIGSQSTAANSQYLTALRPQIESSFPPTN